MAQLTHVTKWLASLDALPEFASVKDQIPAEESQQKHDKSSGKYLPLPNAVVRTNDSQRGGWRVFVCNRLM